MKEFNAHTEELIASDTVNSLVYVSYFYICEIDSLLNVLKYLVSALRFYVDAINY